MKTIDYVNKFVQSVGIISNLNIESASIAIRDVGVEFMQECKDLIQLRKTNSDIAIYAVLYEQDLKWKSFTRQVNEHYNRKVIKPEGFRLIVQAALPDVYDSWMAYDAMQKVAQNLRKPNRMAS